MAFSPMLSCCPEPLAATAEPRGMESDLTFDASETKDQPESADGFR